MIHNPNKQTTPWWMTLIIVIAMIPAMAMPFAMTGLPAENPGRLLTYFYPAYVIASGICAWITYPKRPELTWILIVLLLMSHAAMYILVNGI